VFEKSTATHCNHASAGNIRAKTAKALPFGEDVARILTLVVDVEACDSCRLGDAHAAQTPVRNWTGKEKS
jgi:hypothetical protein